MSLLKALQLQIQPYYIKVTAPFSNHEDCCMLLQALSFNQAILGPGQPTSAPLSRLCSVAFWIKSATWYETFLLDLGKTPLSAVQHGPEVLGEQLGF